LRWPVPALGQSRNLSRAFLNRLACLRRHPIFIRTPHHDFEFVIR